MVDSRRGNRPPRQRKALWGPSPQRARHSPASGLRVLPVRGGIPVGSIVVPPRMAGGLFAFLPYNIGSAPFRVKTRAATTGSPSQDSLVRAPSGVTWRYVPTNEYRLRQGMCQGTTERGQRGRRGTRRKHRDLSCSGEVAAQQGPAQVRHALGSGAWSPPSWLSFRERGDTLARATFGPRASTGLSRYWVPTDFCSTGGPGDRTPRCSHGLRGQDLLREGDEALVSIRGLWVAPPASRSAPTRGPMPRTRDGGNWSACGADAGFLGWHLETWLAPATYAGADRIATRWPPWGMRVVAP